MAKNIMARFGERIKKETAEELIATGIIYSHSWAIEAKRVKKKLTRITVIMKNRILAEAARLRAKTSSYELRVGFSSYKRSIAAQIKNGAKISFFK